ncbi:unnamed protein product [Phytomonas sp. EM1]|nr:unnamed protein product [Phytomonas sp. EM1]|eukprot:CCW63441.1 unnamed protein product [Phytomonas sp. isolate EM1]
MEGKNCFRMRWAQKPIYSGGNIASVGIMTSKDAVNSSVQADPSKDKELRELLVMACGDTVNVVCNRTGSLLCSYTLPIEDVILCVDAVTVLESRSNDPTSPIAVNSKNEAMEELRTTSKGSAGVAKTRKGKKVQREDANSPDGQEKENHPGASPDGGVVADLKVPPGRYVAIGTRLLQLCIFQVVIDGEEHKTTPTVPDPTGEAADEIAGTGVPEAADIDSGHDPKAVSKTSDSFATQAELKLIYQWTAAQHAISAIKFSSGGQYLLSCSTDGSIKGWNAFHHHLTHNLRCPSGGLIQTVYLDPTESLLILGTFEGYVSVFDFQKKVLLAHSRPHVQAVEAITVLHGDTTYICTIARDRKVAFLELRAASRELLERRTVVVKEHLTCARFESPSVLHIGAQDGQVSTYRLSATGPVRLICGTEKPPTPRPPPGAEKEGKDSESLDAMVRCILIAGRPAGVEPRLKGFSVADRDEKELSSLYVADGGFNIAQLSADHAQAKYTVISTLVGFLDQILDVKLLPAAAGDVYERIVVNNSKDVFLYHSPGCLSRQALRGHSGIVMCCAVSSDGSLIATGGVDTEVRFWSTKTWQTVACGVGGHTAEISSMCFNAKQSAESLLLFTISADENLRLWDAGKSVLPLLKRSASDEAAPPLQFSHRSGVNSAHAGQVFALAVSPNDQYVATGGKDKFVHLWNLTGKKLFKEAALKGHRRGISVLAFSPADRVLASASSDGAVRLWSLVSLACVKTLQADKTPVLQLAFFNQGTQLVTGNSDGVLRVWALAAAEAVWSSELHSGKIWALAVKEVPETGETLFFSGATDGSLIATEDFTAEEAEILRQERREGILQEQTLANAIRRGEFAKAFSLALQLSHPRHLRQVLVQWCAKDLTLCEDTLKSEIIPCLTKEDLLRLLNFSREWLTNSRHYNVASVVLSAFFGAYHYVDIAKIPSMGGLVEAFLAYSKKHSQRQHNLLWRTYYLDYLTHAMEPNKLTTMPPFYEQTENCLQDALSEKGVEVGDADEVGEPPKSRVRV